MIKHEPFYKENKKRPGDFHSVSARKIKSREENIDDLLFPQQTPSFLTKSPESWMIESVGDPVGDPIFRKSSYLFPNKSEPLSEPLSKPKPVPTPKSILKKRKFLDEEIVYYDKIIRESGLTQEDLILMAPTLNYHLTEEKLLKLGTHPQLIQEILAEVPDKNKSTGFHRPHKRIGKNPHLIQELLGRKSKKQK